MEGLEFTVQGTQHGQKQSDGSLVSTGAALIPSSTHRNDCSPNHSRKTHPPNKMGNAYVLEP